MHYSIIVINTNSIIAHLALIYDKFDSYLKNLNIFEYYYFLIWLIKYSIHHINFIIQIIFIITLELKFIKI
jgi:hypothetical protein